MNGDSQIISLLEARDEQALQRIREQYGALCFQIAYRMTGSREDAEECFSDLLLDVWNTVPPQRPENLRAYLTSLAGREAIRRYEHTHRQKRGGTQLAACLDELAEILPAPEQVEQTVERRELTAALTAWLRTLSAQQQRLFMQRYYLSESVQAIAQQNDMRESAVKMALLRLRRKLKEHLRKEGLL